MRANSKRGSTSSFSTIFHLLVFLFGVFIGVIFYSQYIYYHQNHPSSSPSSTVTTSIKDSSAEVSSLSKEQCSNLINQYVSGNRSASSDRLKTRKDLPEYLNTLGLTGEGVEVGVKDGVFSKWILSHWSGKKYHLVDPWMEQDQQLYIDIANVSDKKFSPLLIHE
jgi:hypothetical protein